MSTATGNLEPTNEVTIGSEMSGITAEVTVDVNDRVKKGQELARITVRRLEQDIQSGRAAVNSANAKVNQVKATLQENEATLARLEGAASPQRRQDTFEGRHDHRAGSRHARQGRPGQCRSVGGAGEV